MRRIVTTVLSLSMLFVCHAASAASDAAAVKTLLRQMTLEEKAGEMTQLTLDFFSPPHAPGADVSGDPAALDVAKLEEAIVKYHVGSIFNIIRYTLTPGQWHQLLGTIARISATKSRLHIPVLFGIDAMHGANYTVGASLFPHALGLAATFDRDVVGRIAGATASQVRQSGIPWNFAPVLDVGRQPLWPRLYETFGEDTHVVTELGRAFVASHKDAATCLKHYAAYSAPYTGRDRTPARLSRRELRENYLPPFAAAIEAGAQSIMINSGSVDGVPGHANAYLLTQVLRHELKFDGVAVSDWTDIERLHTRDGIADSPKEAVRIAVMAGVDMSMVPSNYAFTQYLIELVHEKKIPMRRIDEAVGRILRMKFALGLKPTTQVAPHEKRADDAALERPQDAKLALQAAQDTMTLLHNANQTLPLRPEARVLVAGPNADSVQALLGGWSYTWQGDDAARYPKGIPTVLEAVRKHAADASHILYAQDMAQALKQAPNVDVIVLCLGEMPYAETPGNIDDLHLELAQRQLAEAMDATGKPVVLVLTEGRPRVLGPMADKAAAVLMAYLPGVAGAEAIASVLYGEHNPSGRLPLTYPRASNALLTYDHTSAEVFEDMTYHPQWPFGAGLGYTTFVYEDLQVKAGAANIKTPVEIDVTVRNTGGRAGKEAVLLYLTDAFASIMRPVRQVRGFTKIELQAGQAQRVHFTLHPKDLGFVNQAGEFTIEPGAFSVQIGSAKASFTLAK